MDYFVSETYIKENGFITNNVDPKSMYPNIGAAQTLYLKVILGSEFYDYLLAKYVAQTLNSNEEDLVLNYIKPAVLNRAQALMLPFINFDVRNKGIMQNTDENANTTDFGVFRFMQNEAKNRAEAAEQELQKYLCKYSSNFPEYTTQDGLTPPDSSSNWDSGLVFYTLLCIISTFI